ncbi:hypothetical protein [Rhizobium mongolense]|uniref:Uncharacterized protein n=1 Tax=Rhizobium mongolense TaxID=57676 RepID=A0A7W6RTB9_9HYPH|nr:hypothetical protein [Rhizobium mongolense]MBB4277696.1 hypothetical protein [Rhizobium mongolense]
MGFTPNGHGPGGRNLKKVQTAEKGGFSRSGRTDQADNIATLRFQRNPPKDVDIREALLDLIGAQDEIRVGDIEVRVDLHFVPRLQVLELGTL